MATGVWNVLDELSAMSRELQSLTNTVYRDPRGETTIGFIPAMDVITRGDDLIVRLELPGIDIDNDVEIDAEQDLLRISGERRVEPGGEKGFHFHEMRYGRFSRSFPLPEGTEPESIRAEYCDGMLDVIVPGGARRLEESRRPKHVPVRNAGNH